MSRSRWDHRSAGVTVPLWSRLSPSGRDCPFYPAPVGLCLTSLNNPRLPPPNNLECDLIPQDGRPSMSQVLALLPTMPPPPPPPPCLVPHWASGPQGPIWHKPMCVPSRYPVMPVGQHWPTPTQAQASHSEKLLPPDHLRRKSPKPSVPKR